MLKTLRAQIILMVGIPITGLLILSAFNIWDKHQLSKQFEVLLPLAEISAAASAVIHELQKERGQTVGVISSGYGLDNVQALGRQRALADPALEGFIETVERTNIRVLDPDLSEFIDEIIEDKREIPAHREKADRRNTTIPENVKFYSKIIHDLVVLISKVAEANPSRELNHYLLPYLTLVEAKEAAGLERAIGAVVLNRAAEGKYDTEQYFAYYDKLAQEKAFLDEFKNFATKKQRALFDQTIAGPEVDQVVEWRGVLARIPDTRDPEGVTGKEWFDAATKRINLMYEVEQAIGRDAAKVAVKEADAFVASEVQLIIVDVVLMLLVASVGVFMGRRIGTGLKQALGDINRLAGGDHDFQVGMREREDEFGDIGRALEIFRAQAEERELLEKKALEAQEEAERTRAQLLAGLSSEFEQTMSEMMRDINKQTDSLEHIAETLVEKSDSSGGRSLKVAEASLGTSDKVEAVAVSGTELSDTIREVSERIAETTATMQAVVREVDDAASRISSLQEASQEIGNVVQLINDIAGQTNLLALNATIEAARAGEAGKGFAVVAAEVKNLSTQTEKATSQISQEIQSIQDQTGSAVDSIRSIENSIRDADQVVSAIAAAVEEQSAAADQISQNMGAISEEATTVTEEIAYVCQASAGSSGIAIKVIWSIDDLKEIRDNLDEGSRSFLSALRDESVARDDSVAAD